jgi:two-component system, OmpR family, sensor histidine kinase ChvG
VSIRLQLLVVALSTLVLPWAGWHYARELEAALRGSQEQSLLASAGTIANALSAQPQRVFRNADLRAYDARGGDLYVHPLLNQPLLDGYREDWGIAWDPAVLPTVNGYHARLQVGSTERYLYLYVEVDDSHFDAEPNAVQPGQGHFDRIDIWLPRDDGTTTNYFFATTAPGLTAAQYVTNEREAAGTDEDSARIAPETRIQAYWLQAAQGYHLEARIPLSFIGGQMWIQVRDGGGKGSAGFTPEANAAGGRLFFATDGLDGLLGTFIREGTRATVIDNNALELGSAGRVATEAVDDADEKHGGWYRTWLETDASNLPPLTISGGKLGGDSVRSALSGEPLTQWVRGDDGRLLLTAAAPIIVEGVARGVVLLEQNAEQMLELRAEAFSRLFTLTLLATATAMIVMLLFAAWMTFRIGRLRNAADSAVGNDGSIRLSMPESRRGDEIGALARGFERLLARLNEHTQYLRTLGGKLSHELRTPLTIVRSSLDNLESHDLPEEQRTYITRAREGTQRLQTILTSLGAAARVEESIKQADRVNFDLRELISSTVAAYRDGFPASSFGLEVPDDPCFLRGAPDLIAQLLDKLIENAVDFCPPAGRIRVRLARESGIYLLDVNNDGPRIPDEVLKHLFESLYEQRSGRDDKPHFGLGLYIVRLIAEFHGGTASAANRDDDGGAVFTVMLPMI